MPKLRRAIQLSIALFLTWASIAMVRLPWIVGEEQDLIPTCTAIKIWLNRHVFPNQLYDTSFIRNHFLVVNTTRDQALTSEYDPMDPKKTPGIPITDRQKLTDLLRMCNQYPSTYGQVICDVQFQLPSTKKSTDDSLGYYIGLLQSKGKIIFGAAYDRRSGQYECSSIPLEKKNIGFTNRDEVSGYYFRHTLSYRQAEVVSLPFLMYARHHHAHLENSRVPGLVNIVTREGSHLCYNSFIPEMLFSKADFDRYYNDPSLQDNLLYSRHMAICDLGTIAGDKSGLTFRSLLDTVFCKKDIFIGAITGKHADRYSTLYGELDGTIILLNTYYCLELHYNEVSMLHLLISLGFFLFIAWRIVYDKQKKHKAPKTLRQYIKYVVIKRSYYLSLLGLTALSYFVFHHETNLIVLLILIEILHAIAGHVRKYRIIRQAVPDEVVVG